MIWLRSFAGLYILLTYRGADGNKIIISGSDFLEPSIDNCICHDRNGKIYNLGPLEKDDGTSRFTAKGSGQWMYSYNPCRSFSLGPPQKSDCFGNVAICMWTSNNARYQNIGKQTTAECYFNRETLTPQLVYSNTGPFKNWKAIVDFKCDPSKKTPEEAEFDFISANNNIWRFLVTSICACPDGCPSDPEDADTASPPPTPCDDGDKLYCIISCTSIAGILVIIVIGKLIFLNRRRICGGCMEQNHYERPR